MDDEPYLNLFSEAGSCCSEQGCNGMEIGKQWEEHETTTWWLIPLSKWVITPVISGLTRPLSHVNHWGELTHLRAVGSSPPSMVKFGDQTSGDTVDQ